MNAKKAPRGNDRCTTSKRALGFASAAAARVHTGLARPHPLAMNPKFGQAPTSG
jgi:hypothetical protein